MGSTGPGTVLREFIGDDTFLIRNAVRQGCSMVKLSRYRQGAGSHLHHCKEGEKGGRGMLLRLSNSSDTRMEMKRFCKRQTVIATIHCLGHLLSSLLKLRAMYNAFQISQP